MKEIHAQELLNLLYLVDLVWYSACKVASALRAFNILDRSVEGPPFGLVIFVLHFDSHSILRG